jgi:ArsR family transcriptional regulator
MNTLFHELESVNPNMKESGKSTSDTLERLFSALSDRTRLRLLNLMAESEICVCFFVEVLDIPQPKISRHLAYLRSCGLVATRREGKWVHYRLVQPEDPRAARVFTEVLAWLTDETQMKHDRKRLATLCCATLVPLGLREAPRPTVKRVREESDPVPDHAVVTAL